MSFAVSYDGYCSICEEEKVFSAARDDVLDEKWMPHWFRSSLRCEECKSPPRERALAYVIQNNLPNWREKRIHECSPGGWALSAKLRRECRDYVASQYDPSFAFGEMHTSGRCRTKTSKN